MVCILGNIDKPSSPGTAVPHTGGVDMPVSVHLARSHIGNIHSGPVVIQHLLLMVNHGGQVFADAKINPTGLYAAVDT
ncbi:hypothetical protein D3C78_1700030 [compost metagenome]